MVPARESRDQNVMRVYSIGLAERTSADRSRPPRRITPFSRLRRGLKLGGSAVSSLLLAEVGIDLVFMKYLEKFEFYPLVHPKTLWTDIAGC